VVGVVVGVGMISPLLKEARPIARFIRKMVERPDVLPVLGRFPGPGFGYCPLGLLPMAVHETPSLAGPRFTKGDTPRGWIKFYKWWDVESVKDPQAAMDAVWGRER
jgi:hypothetical protein